MENLPERDDDVHRVFWCVLDYGTGEWLLRIAAPSAAAIRARFPALEVLAGVPGWFEAEERELARYPRFDLAHPPPDLGAAMEAFASGGGRRLYFVRLRTDGAERAYRVWADNLVAVESRWPGAEVLPMVLAPADAWRMELRELEGSARPNR